MTSNRAGDPVSSSKRADGCPALTGRFGSLDAFWHLIEPVLTSLQPSRVCEIGVEKGIFTARLLAWGRANRCAYIGVDPAPDEAASALILATEEESAGLVNRLCRARSLDALPDLERCDAYFIDGDHNYHTVRKELELITRGVDPATGRAPVIFAHDVSWPFARRDMYHDPASIAPADRHPYAADLGVSLDGDELIPGGLRSPGQYSIALQAGGACNGVLTAIEDFLASDDGQGWCFVAVPIAYGLGILFRPEDGALPEPCRAFLRDLGTGMGAAGGFLASCEANFLQLYLYAEQAKYDLDAQMSAVHLERCAHCQTMEAYQQLETAYQEAAVVHEALAQQYQSLLESYGRLDNEYRALLAHCHAVQRHVDQSIVPVEPIPASRVGTFAQTAGTSAMTPARE